MCIIKKQFFQLNVQGLKPYQQFITPDKEYPNCPIMATHQNQEHLQTSNPYTDCAKHTQKMHPSLFVSHIGLTSEFFSLHLLILLMHPSIFSYTKNTPKCTWIGSPGCYRMVNQWLPILCGWHRLAIRIYLDPGVTNLLWVAWIGYP